jgi:hypothetical protein
VPVTELATYVTVAGSVSRMLTVLAESVPTSPYLIVYVTVEPGTGFAVFTVLRMNRLAVLDAVNETLSFCVGEPGGPDGVIKALFVTVLPFTTVESI